MDFGGIIKGAWRITWRHKALWVLGLFAGVSGCQGGASGGGSGGTSRGSGQANQIPGFTSPGDVERIYDRFIGLLPALLAMLAVLAVLGVVWSVLALAARGGLVTGVHMIEEGAPFTLGGLWRAGFSRFWTLVALDIVLSLPLFATGMLMLVFIIVPLIATIAAGGDPGAELIAPACGSLAIGVPVLLAGGFVLGLMHLIALRYVMIGGQGALEAAGNAWRFFRARFKDAALMWLLSAALNTGASFVVAIPAALVGIVMVVPVAVSVSSGDLGALFAIIPAIIGLVVVVGLAYNAVWGTFTSALWTLYFRRVQGMGPHTPEPPAAPTSARAHPSSPDVPAAASSDVLGTDATGGA